MAAALCIMPCISYAQTIKVTDGDTIRIGKERIRLIGYDTPEKGDNAKCYEEHKRAMYATNYLKSLIQDKTKQKDIRRTGKDRYGRTLAYLYIDDIDVSEIMIGKDLAVRYECHKNRCPKKIDWCSVLKK